MPKLNDWPHLGNSLERIDPMPSAVVNIVIATEYDVEPEFVTGAVLVTTLLSPLSLTPLLAALGA